MNVKNFDHHLTDFRRFGFDLLLLTALTCLFVYDLQSVSRNSDEASSLLAGYDMLHGNFFLSGWIMPPDSFWLLDDLLYGLLTCIFGMRPNILYIVPSFTWALVVVLTLKIIPIRSGLSHVGQRLIVMTTMIFPPFVYGDALHFIGDSPGHAMTLACALAGLILANHCIRGATISYVALGLYAATIIACVTSDPFGLVIYIAPICIALAIKFPQAELRSRSTILFSITALSYGIGRFVLTESSHHGGFVSPGIHNEFTSLAELPKNFALFEQSIMTLFGADFFSKKLSGSFFRGPIPNLLRFPLIILTALAIVKALQSVWRILLDTEREKEVSLTYVFSVIALTSCAISVVLSTYMVNVTCMRYLLPVLVFGTILLDQRYGEVVRLLPLYGLQLIVAVLMVLILPPGKVTASSGPMSFDSVAGGIRTKGFTNGYAGYWDASILTAYGRGKFSVRPVIRGGACGFKRYAWFSKENWYSVEEFGQTDSVFFITNDNENIFLSRKEILERFGAPTQSYRLDKLSMDVYRRSQLPPGCPGKS